MAGAVYDGIHADHSSVDDAKLPANEEYAR